jgi:4-amino-4-deoxy-L-arabinose transferase-like glycosyltransferase
MSPPTSQATDLAGPLPVETRSKPARTDWFSSLINRVNQLSASPARVFGLLLLLAVGYWGGEYALRDLWEPDEARFAYVAEEMRADGHWLVPHRHGEYYAHKPPLMFWLMNAAGAVTGTGINAVTARLPTLLGAVAALWSVWMLMVLWGRRAEAPWAALICATTYLFWKQGGWGQIDMLLCGLQMLSVYFLFAQGQTRSVKQALLAYVFMGLAILAKGPVGFLVPWGVYLTAKLAAGERADLKRWHWVWGPLVTLVFPAVWLLLVWQSHPPEGYLRELLFAQNLERVQGEFGHRRPFYYFLLHFPLDGLPWTLWLPFAWRALDASPEDRALRRRLAGWILFVIAFFTLSSSKRNLYILLAYPALAMLIAAGWAGIRKTHAARGLASALSSLPLVVGIGLVAAGLVSLGAPTVLPVDLRWALAAGVMVLAVTWSIHRALRVDPGAERLTTQSLARLVLPLLIAFASVGTFVLPGLNAIKTPRELIPLAETRLRSGEPLHLYRLNGEIQAWYAGRRGAFVADEAALQQVIATQPHGLIVAEKGRRGRAPSPNQLPLHRLPNVRHGEFQMGGKIMQWAEWSPDTGITEPRPDASQPGAGGE